VIGDVARAIAAAPRGHYHAILLDLYEGPHAATQRADDPFYGGPALARAAPRWPRAARSRCVVRGSRRGIRAPAGQRRVEVDVHRFGKPRRHVVYLARRT